MKRIYLHNFGVNLNYIMRDTQFKNRYFNHDPWRIQEEWYLRIGLKASFFDWYKTYYDGHTYTSLTLFGVEFGWGYSYDSRPLKDWSAA